MVKSDLFIVTMVHIQFKLRNKIQSRTFIQDKATIIYTHKKSNYFTDITFSLFAKPANLIMCPCQCAASK